MNWWLVLFVACFAVGLIGTGAILAFRVYKNPFLLWGFAHIVWVSLRPVLVQKVLPLFLRVFKRYDPETEAAWRACERSGGKWNRRTKRCE